MVWKQWKLINVTPKAVSSPCKDMLICWTYTRNLCWPLLCFGTGICSEDHCSAVPARMGTTFHSHFQCKTRRRYSLENSQACLQVLQVELTNDFEKTPYFLPRSVRKHLSKSKNNQLSSAFFQESKGCEKNRSYFMSRWFSRFFSPLPGF